jgi:hypothetical protein
MMGIYRTIPARRLEIRGTIGHGGLEWRRPAGSPATPSAMRALGQEKYRLLHQRRRRAILAARRAVERVENAAG